MHLLDLFLPAYYSWMSDYEAPTYIPRPGEFADQRISTESNFVYKAQPLLEPLGLN